MKRLNSEQLRDIVPTPKQIEEIKKKRRDIYIILDNVLDTYNVGAIFRLADAVSAKKVYLCGETETPPNPRIMKASINTWQWVEWEYFADAKTAIQDLRLKINDLRIIAVEQTEKSISYTEADYSLPAALVVGHETYGVSKETLDTCDAIVELPMLGINKSLNVMVSLGIVLYEVIRNNKLAP